MPNIRKYSLAILNYYKSLGIEFHIQNKQRVRFDDHFYPENEDKVLLENKLKVYCLLFVSFSSLILLNHL